MIVVASTYVGKESFPLRFFQQAAIQPPQLRRTVGLKAPTKLCGIVGYKNRHQRSTAINYSLYSQFRRFEHNSKESVWCVGFIGKIIWW